ncbi:MAG: YceI family protein [Armatimonadetes bacterium]|nr:YceI family protein [Armatimonadota bacterium]
MKSRVAVAVIAAISLLASAVILHPGVAFARPEYATPGREIAFIQSGSYSVDPLHTSVGFEVWHLGIAKVQGRFTKKSGKIVVNANDITRSSVSFSIEADSIDTAVAPRDQHLRSADFFEVAKYPQIRFESARIRKTESGYVADGKLTMKAVTKDVSIPFKVYGPITDPWGGTRIGVVAEPITLNRQDFGIAYNDKLPDGTPAVGNEVTVHLALEAVLDKP